MRKNAIKKTILKVLSAVLLIQFAISTVCGADIGFNNEVSKFEKEELIVGGQAFGVRFFTGGLTVIGFSKIETASEDKSPAYSAGLRENDFITAINGGAVERAEDFINKIENCKGMPIAIDFKRNGKIMSVSVTPVISSDDGKYKTGMWIKDSAAGIGTVTYIVPETGEFGGLGHSIYDGDDETKISGGYVTDVTISGIKPGEGGVPGELKGTFSENKIGTLKCNTKVGVFGVFATLPKFSDENLKLPVASPDEIETGRAKIRCTVGEEKIEEFDISIKEKSVDEPTNKNFVIEITDEKLIEKTGGIVQGMSGSPIIQNGKIVGAVTHVLINDPKKGYGIYIGNMLNCESGAVS